MNITPIVEPCRDGSGNWYWAVKVDGGIWADGETESRMAAQCKCSAAMEEYAAQSDGSEADQG